jgi:hypothetical protein
MQFTAERASYRGFQFGYGSMRAALDLLRGQEREEALDPIDPG